MRQEHTTPDTVAGWRPAHLRKRRPGYLSKHISSFQTWEGEILFTWWFTIMPFMERRIDQVDQLALSLSTRAVYVLHVLSCSSNPCQCPGPVPVVPPPNVKGRTPLLLPWTRASPPLTFQMECCASTTASGYQDPYFHSPNKK